MGEQCRLGFHERIGPALDDATLSVNGEISFLRIEHDFDVLALQPLADLEGLAEQLNVSVGRDLTNERHVPHRDGQRVERNVEVRGQLLQFLLAAMLDRPAWAGTLRAAHAVR